MILVCVLTIGAVFASFTTDTEKTEKVEQNQLKQLSILLSPTGVNYMKKTDDWKYKSTVCKGGTGTASWMVWEDTSGKFWVTPSQDVQETGQGTWQVSEEGADLVCKLSGKDSKTDD